MKKKYFLFWWFQKLSLSLHQKNKENNINHLKKGGNL